jgi:predicted nucleic acid-binding protein
VDTNVPVAALRNPAGVSREIIRACATTRAVPLIGEKLFLDYEDVLGRSDIFQRSPLSLRERQEFLDGFLGLCEWTSVAYLWRPNLPDEGDNHVLELAVAGSAQSIITGNIRDFARGVLRFPNIEILTARQFMERIA